MGHLVESTIEDAAEAIWRELGIPVRRGVQIDKTCEKLVALCDCLPKVLWGQVLVAEWE